MTTIITATVYIVSLVTIYGVIGYFIKETIKEVIEMLKED